VFIAAIFVFTISSVLCGLVHSLRNRPERSIQGIGGAMMNPLDALS